MMIARSQCAPSQLIGHLQEARARLLDLVADLDDEQMTGERLAVVNPLRWEIAHVAFFQEFWLLRHLRGFDAIRPAPHLDPDRLYDSARVAHDTRWDLPLPSKRETIAYMRRILDRVIEETMKGAGDLRDAGGYDEAYLLELALLHEDMHSEAITYTRQTLAVRSPAFSRNGSASGIPAQAGATNARLGDAQIPGGRFMLGSVNDSGFVFDNEQWAHEVVVEPFSISRTAVRQAEFAGFVNDAGYRRRELWSDEGWGWREFAGAAHPVYWRPAGKDEWEMAASCEPAADARGVASRARKYPWGAEPPSPERANLDWREGGCVPVNAAPAGDSAFGVRQMIGNVWEWTATDFGPYPGFAAGPYKEYSAPWFGDHKVLRGGCWATRSRLIRNNYRNFYKPDRRDVWAGFRTCAL